MSIFLAGSVPHEFLLLFHRWCCIIVLFQGCRQLIANFARYLNEFPGLSTAPFGSAAAVATIIYLTIGPRDRNNPLILQPWLYRIQTLYFF